MEGLSWEAGGPVSDGADGGTVSGGTVGSSLCILKGTRDFPGGLVVKTLHVQCRGHGINPWSGN